MRYILVICSMCALILFAMPATGSGPQEEPPGNDSSAIAAQEQDIIEVMELLEMLTHMEEMTAPDRIQKDLNHENND